MYVSGEHGMLVVAIGTTRQGQLLHTHNIPQYNMPHLSTSKIENDCTYINTDIRSTYIVHAHEGTKQTVHRQRWFSPSLSGDMLPF